MRCPADARRLGVNHFVNGELLDVGKSARQDLTTILTKGSYTDNAADVRGEIAAMPTADDVAEAVSATL